MSAAASNALVRFVDVSKSYDGRTNVVEGLNLDIEQGEFITLLGPSGSGKTTCLMMLAGFEPISGGDIIVDGRSISSIPAQKRNIGVVFQSYALFPHMTVAENIAFPLKARGMAKSEIEPKTTRALKMIRLDTLAGRLPGQLSGGQQQRVALARSLVFKPELVLMDEPLGALDKQLREEMQHEIMHIQRNLGVTVVYVTHDQSEALTMSDRVAVFDGGEIKQLATPRQLYQAPANSFVARFIGENNRLWGTVAGVSGARCMVTLANSSTVAAVPVGVAATGDATILSIRPECVRVGAAAQGAANVFDATIDETIFHGDHLRMSVTLCGCPGFVVKIPSGAEGEIGATGSTIRLGWDENDCLALDQDTRQNA